MSEEPANSAPEKPVSLWRRLHQSHANQRRIETLAAHLDRLTPRNARLLDVGCGDGRVGDTLQRRRPDIRYEGTEVVVREGSAIPVRLFDGLHIPFGDDAFDGVVMIDVLHHATDPVALLREAIRVSCGHLIIKDHRLDGLFARATLRFMDHVGNEGHAMDMPYDYWPEAKTRAVWAELGLEVEEFTCDVNLYARPASLVFGRSLHYFARLAVPR
ncbi:MAG: SAM-dependent methyltransferase [Verrucomicrobiales bacterium]|jgi:SAM-dependent methyltransferase